MKTSRFKALCTVLFTVFLMSHAALAENEKAEAIERLENQLELLESVQRYTPRYKQGQILVLRKYTKASIASINKLGIAHVDTFDTFQDQIMAYRAAQAYLKERADDAQDEIEALNGITKTIKEVHGIKDDAYTRFTARVYTQVNLLIGELLNRPISDDLKQELEAVLKESYLLEAKRDSDLTYEYAKPVYLKIEALYPKMALIKDEVSFEKVLLIQGLNKQFAEHSEVDRVIELNAGPKSVPKME